MEASNRNPNGNDSAIDTIKASFHRRPTRDSIPQEVVDSWLAGKYEVGVRPSLGYQYIGWSLMLRGFYTYETFDKDDQMTHWGYCYIDLRDGELEYAGIRLWTSAQYMPVRCPVYWRSIFSRFVSSPSAQRLFFGYIAYRVAGEFSELTSWLASKNDASDIKNRWDSLSTFDHQQLKGMDDFWNGIPAMTINCPATAAEITNDVNNAILDYMTDKLKFDAHLELCGKILPVEPLFGILELDIGRIEPGAKTFNGKYLGLPPVKIEGLQCYHPAMPKTA